MVIGAKLYRSTRVVSWDGKCLGKYCSVGLCWTHWFGVGIFGRFFVLCRPFCCNLGEMQLRSFLGLQLRFCCVVANICSMFPLNFQFIVKGCTKKLYKYCSFCNSRCNECDVNLFFTVLPDFVCFRIAMQRQERERRKTEEAKRNEREQKEREEEERMAQLKEDAEVRSGFSIFYSFP